MHPDIVSILATFTKQDLCFMNSGCIFHNPAYQSIIHQDNLPVCFIEGQTYGNDVYLNIGVVPSARRTGVARKAFSKLLDWFTTTNHTAIRWNAHVSNVASIKFAQTLGFTEIESPDPKTRYFALGNHTQT